MVNEMNVARWQAQSQSQSHAHALELFHDSNLLVMLFSGGGRSPRRRVKVS